MSVFKGYTGITEETKQRLKQLQSESGRTPSMLLKGRMDIPDGLTARQISSWISGRSKSAKTSHLDYVLTLWASLDKVVYCDASDLASLVFEIKSHKISPQQIYYILDGGIPGYGRGMLARIINGRIETISQNDFEILKKFVR